MRRLGGGARVGTIRSGEVGVEQCGFAGDSTCPELNLQVIGAFWSGVREEERVTSDILMSRRTPKSAAGLKGTAGLADVLEAGTAR